MIYKIVRIKVESVPKNILKYILYVLPFQMQGLYLWKILIKCEILSPYRLIIILKHLSVL